MSDFEDGTKTTFELILDELKVNEDITINWPADEQYPDSFKLDVFYPGDTLDKATQMKFLMSYYPRIIWNVTVFQSSVNDAVRYLLDVIDISRSSVINFQTIVNNMKTPKKLRKFYKRAIIEIAETIDSVEMGFVELENTYLEGVEKDSLQKLYVHWTFLLNA